MKEHFLKIYNYNFWANKRLAGSINSQGIDNEMVMKLFSHIVLSEQLWMLRMEGGDYLGKNFWKVLSLPECETIMNENKTKYIDFISVKNFSETATYKNSKGIEYTTSIYDILTHVSFHSAYHRAQIAKEVRRLNKEPVLTDYIAFVRENG